MSNRVIIFTFGQSQRMLEIMLLQGIQSRFNITPSKTNETKRPLYPVIRRMPPKYVKKPYDMRKLGSVLHKQGRR
jgi:hypothetical protein